METRIGECDRLLRLKEEEYNSELNCMRRLIDERDEVHRREIRELELEKKKSVMIMREKNEQLALELELNKKEFDSLRWTTRERHYDLDEKEKEIEGRAKEFESREKRIEERVKELELKEKEYRGRVKVLESKERLFERRVKERESKEKRIERGMQELELKEREFEGKLMEHESKQKDFERQMKEFESKQKDFEVKQVREKESNRKHFEGKRNELESERKQFEEKEKELASKQKDFEIKLKELELKEKYYEGRVQELELRENQVELMAKEVESKMKQFEGQTKDHESKKKHYEAQMKFLESKEVKFKMQLKELKSKENQFEGQKKELELKKNQYKHFGGQLKGFEFKETQCKSLRIPSDEEKLLEKVLEDEYRILAHQVKTESKYFRDANKMDNTKHLELLFNILEKYELICNQVSDALQTSVDPTKLVLDTMKGFCPPQLGQQLAESEANPVRRAFNLLMDELKKSAPVIGFHVKEEAIKLASDWKADIDVADKDCLEVLDFFKLIATYEIGSSFDENELQSLLYTIVQHCQAPQVLDDIEKLRDNQFSSSKTDGRNLQLLSNEPEFIDNGSLVTLQMSPDPAELVLEILMNPILPKNGKGNEASISDESHIFLLERLMRMSPDIKPHVREEALKLAIDLKDSMRGSTENSSVVLGFLLLLSIYGLVSYFKEDEVLKLVEVVAQHKLAVELFHTLGFVDKIDDFVKNLIMKKQHIEAVRFICAYKLADKIQPVNLLPQHTEWVKRISPGHRRKKCTETKIRATDKEIASLRAALQFISDNNIESQDLVDEINDRIVFLEKQKEDIVREAESSSIVEVQQPEEKRPADEAIATKILVQQDKEKKHANEGVSENQVEVERPDTSVVPSDGAFTMNQIKWQGSRLKRCNTEAVTMDQVQQPQQKKRAIEAIEVPHRLEIRPLNST